MCSIDAQGGEKFFSMCRNKIGEIAERCFQNFMERIASLKPVDKMPPTLDVEDHDSRDCTPLENSMPEGKLEQLSSQNEINLAEDSSEADGGDDDSSSVATETSEGTLDSEKSLGDADSVPQKRVSKKNRTSKRGRKS